tara:strand:+ start:36673 stop:36846 length:174 start_codon:yes stop_codon:yes gene_type:complete
MELLMNPEVLCLLTIMFIMLTIMTSGVLGMLWGSCAIGTVGVLWWHIINQDADDEDF